MMARSRLQRISEQMGRDLRLIYAQHGGFFEDADLDSGRTPRSGFDRDLLLVDGLDAITQAGSFIMQTSGESGSSEITLIVALITLADAAGATVAMRLPSLGLRTQIVLAALGAGLAAIALMTTALFIPITIALSFATGVSHPMRATAIQRLASDGMRARAASVANACDMALSTIVLLAAGSLLTGRR